MSDFISADKPSIFENSRGERFEYYTYGSKDGYPVLYMHGSVPMPFSPNLAEIIQNQKLYLIVVLRPGYGASSRLNPKHVFDYVLMLNELISSFQLKRCNVLGLSAGAPYAYALAAAYPDLVEGVNICSGVPLVNNKVIYDMITRGERVLFFLSRHLPADWIGKYGVKAMESMERKKGWKDPECGQSMDDVFRKYVRPNWHGIGQSTSIQYKDWGFAAEAIVKKVYIYHSRADEMVPFEIARKSAGLLLNREFFEYEKEEHSSEKIVEDAIVNIAKREQ